MYGSGNFQERFMEAEEQRIDGKEEGTMKVAVHRRVHHQLYKGTTSAIIGAYRENGGWKNGISSCKGKHTGSKRYREKNDAWKQSREI